jgi:hypothetical protein
LPQPEVAALGYIKINKVSKEFFMAGLFLIMFIALLATFWQQRVAAIGLVLAGIILSLIMFCYHATSTLQINW